MRPIIGITPEIAEDGKISLNYAYTHAIEQAGGIPYVLPCTEDEALLDELVALCHGFCFSGGEDIEPARYGEEKLPQCGAQALRRDAFDFRLFEKALATGKPILGICRGGQLINVALGGTLWQDLPSQHPSELSHVQKEGAFEHSHSVSILPDTPLAAITGKNRITANSFHHQAIKTLGRGLVPMAFAEDGIIEAVYSTEHPFIRAYQWHPERLFDADEHHKKIFSDFITACKEI